MAAINPIVVNFYSLIVVYDVKLSNIRRLPGPGVSIVPQLQWQVGLPDW